MAKETASKDGLGGGWEPFLKPWKEALLGEKYCGPAAEEKPISPALLFPLQVSFQPPYLSFLQVGLAQSDLSLAKTAAVRAAHQGPELHAGGFHLLDLWGLRALFPCAQGILEGPPAEDESLWLEHPHHVSAAPMPVPCGASGVCVRASSWEPGVARMGEPWQTLTRAASDRKTASLFLIPAALPISGDEGWG